MKKQFLLLIVFCFITQLLPNNAENFAASFINNFDMATNARDTHEYHPFMLNKTCGLFEQLEEYLGSHFDLKGRIIICGYQEDAVPSYYSRHHSDDIDDEVSIKTDQGWDFASRSMFGFLVGFLFSDINFPKNSAYIFEHILPERVGIFDARAKMFQKHAFGQAFEITRLMKAQIQKFVCQGNVKKTLKVLHEYLQHLYKHDYVDGLSERIATQDMIFFMHFVHFLCESSLSIKKFFVGPDITYPIEVTSCQSKQATQPAQFFVQRFLRELTPIDGKKTAYIFCSFVDGVGKSTLLGNLRNWHAHGANFAQYERVDNSSTQMAQLFDLDDQVVIVDLPAQVSHVLVKPDGYVFVSGDTVKGFDERKNSFDEYLDIHQNYLIDAFQNTLSQLQKQKNEAGLDLHQDDAPYLSYCKNVAILEALKPWIPFEYENELYLFNPSDKNQRRTLVPFECVHSQGLKVIEPEQMLFLKGLSLPAPYHQFLEDLRSKLKKADVQNIVFVDFMSMYPRTSRATIRVNFLLQQMKLIFGDLFNQSKSLYKSFCMPQELYPLLRNNTVEVMRSLLLDVMMHMSLHAIVNQTRESHHVPLHEIAPLLRTTFFELYANNKNYVCDCIHQKLSAELHNLTLRYASNKHFESVIQFNANAVVQFSQFMQRLFTQCIQDECLNASWHDVFNDGEIINSIDKECKDPVAMQEFIATVRAHWFAALSQLVYCRSDEFGGWRCDPKAVGVLPMMVEGVGDQLCIKRSTIPKSEVVQKSLPQPFEKYGKRAMTSYLGRHVCLDWSGIATDKDIFAYGYNPEISTPLGSIVAQCKRQFADQQLDDNFVSTSLIYNSLLRSSCLYTVKNSRNKKHICKPALQLWVRAVATLDMILKDCDADIMVRLHDKDDFIAAIKLLEQITLPTYFGISLEAPLFDDYNEIKPVIPIFDRHS